MFCTICALFVLLSVLGGGSQDQVKNKMQVPDCLGENVHVGWGSEDSKWPELPGLPNLVVWDVIEEWQCKHIYR